MLNKKYLSLLLGASALLASNNLHAQPPGFGGGGGGFGGGGFGGGGFGRGGGEGGPGGGMMMMGGRGGFDPSSFITRLDANGNGSLDPEEMQGPAKFFLDRMAQGNPNLDLTKPIPLATITSEFEKMRGGGGGGGGGGFGGGWGGGGWGGGEGDDSNGAAAVELVPGFGRKAKLEPPKGFGSKSETLSVKVEEQDIREADDRMRRYDRNRDGMLDEEELKGLRWNDNPMQYDKNRDKKLNAQELGIRYARRRIADAANPDKGKDGRDGGRDRRGGGGGGWGNWAQAGAQGPGGAPAIEEKKSEVAAYREKTASFKFENEARKTTGVPGFLIDMDTNKDGQVSLREFASTIDASVIEEFNRFDTNSDGFITTSEGLYAAKNNILRTKTGSGSSSSSSSSSSSKAASTGKIPRDGLPEGAEDKWVIWCEKKIIEKDKNGSGNLSSDEWSASEGAFDTIDADRDGVITLAEYYIHRKSSKK